MGKIFKIGLAKKCWNDSFDWVFELIDVLKAAYLNKSKITDITESKKVLKAAKNRLEERKKQIIFQTDQINIHVKPVRNFKLSLGRLLNSTEINFSKSMKVPPNSFDLFDSIDNQELNEQQLDIYLTKIKTNLETNWESFNQSYGRMLIKMKMNNYKVE